MEPVTPSIVPRRRLLARNFILAITCACLFVTGLTLVVESIDAHRKATRHREEVFRKIELGFLPLITNSLWVSDQAMLTAQMRGLSLFPFVQYVEVVQNGKPIIEEGRFTVSGATVREYPLDYTYGGNSHPLGTLRVVATDASIYEELHRNVGWMVLGETVKVLILGAIIFCLFQHQAGRHLERMAAYAATLTGESLATPLSLMRPSRPADKEDEIGILAGALEGMRQRIVSHIEKQRTAENAARELKDRLQFILDSTAEGIYGLDRRGNCIFCNAAALHMLGYPDEKVVIGQNMHQLAHHTRNDGRSHLSEDCPAHITMKDGTPRHSDEETFWRSDGHPLPVEMRSHPIRRDGEVIGAVVTFMDISAQKYAQAESDRLQTRLHQAQKLEAIGTLAGGIAHDFNNILTIIIGFSELATDCAQPDSPLAKYLANILIATQRAREVVTQILAFSRRETHQKSALNLAPIVKEALKLLRPAIPSSIDISLDISPNCGTVFAEPTQVHQIIMNLCTNAYQAMEESGGTLSLRLVHLRLPEDVPSPPPGLPPGDYVVLEVRDTGTGMGQQLIDRIFDPYFTTKAVGKGTGLGLAVVHGIVQDLAGGISVESEKGKGSTFRIFLPRAGVPAPVTEVISPSAILPRGQERVLLVDDEESIVKSLEMLLSFCGYEVTGYTDSEVALARFMENPAAFDLLFTDQTMPHLTGDQLAQKALALRPDLPIILCTGHSTRISPETARAAGIREFLCKPVDRRELTTVVRRVLDQATPPSSATV